MRWPFLIHFQDAEVLARTEDEATWVCTAGVVLKSQEHRTMLRLVAEDSWAIEEAALNCEGKRWHQELVGNAS